MNGLGVRARLGVGERRHRADLAGPMAALAVGLQDWQDVLVEGGRCRGEVGGEVGGEEEEDGREHGYDESDSGLATLKGEAFAPRPESRDLCVFFY